MHVRPPTRPAPPPFGRHAWAVCLALSGGAFVGCFEGSPLPATADAGPPDALEAPDASGASDSGDPGGDSGESRDGADASTDGGAKVTMDVACDQVAATICRAHDECLTDYVTLLFGSMAKCVERRKASCLSVLRSPAIRATPDDFVGCIPRFKALSCTSTALFGGIESFAQCADRPGATPEGGACARDAECAKSNCNARVDKPYCGVCGATPKAGEAGGACLEGKCAPGLTCIDKRCSKATTAGLGEPCGPTRPCAVSVVCLAAKCTLPAKLGEACHPEGKGNPPCSDLASCVESPVTPGKLTCERLKTAPVGEACGDVGGKRVACAGDAWCGGDGAGGLKCLARTSDGEPCKDSHGDDCLELALCLDGTCRIPDVSACSK